MDSKSKIFVFEIFVNFKFKRQRSDLSEPSPPPRSRSPRYPTTPNFNGWTDEEARRSKSRRPALLQNPSKKFKRDSRYTGSDNKEDDFNDFSMNKGFIQYDL